MVGGCAVPWQRRQQQQYMLGLVLYGKRSIMQKYCRHNARNAVFPLPPRLLLFSLIFAISKNRNTFFAPLTKNFTGKEKLKRKGVSAIFMTSLSLSENSREFFSSSVNRCIFAASTSTSKAWKPRLRTRRHLTGFFYLRK